MDKEEYETFKEHLLSKIADQPDSSLPRLTVKEAAIREAHSLADIDGYGDEGEGYDYSVFARELEARGWVFQPAATAREEAKPGRSEIVTVTCPCGAPTPHCHCDADYRPHIHRKPTQTDRLLPDVGRK